MSDKRWKPIRKYFPAGHCPDDRHGRKPIPIRKASEVVLRILNVGAQWLMHSQSCPNRKAVHRRFQE